MSSKYSNLKGSLILCLTALIWGLAFVAQSDAAQLVPPFLMGSMRSFISALFLLIVYIILNHGKMPLIPKEPASRKTVLTGGMICGVALAVSTNLQQFGIAFYPDGAAVEAHAGFITALYVILVPIFSIFQKKRVPLLVWFAVIVALSGFYMLCFSGGPDGLYIGDLFIFFCAIAFSVHIMCVDKFVDAVGPIRLSLLQFAVCGVISGLLSLIFEFNTISMQNIISAAPQILYLGIMSSGVAYTLQIVGQRYAEPTIASLSMSLESVFAALGGWFISGNTLAANEIIGCVLVFVAIILAQLPSPAQNSCTQK